MKNVVFQNKQKQKPVCFFVSLPLLVGVPPETSRWKHGQLKIILYLIFSWTMVNIKKNNCRKLSREPGSNLGFKRVNRAFLLLLRACKKYVKNIEAGSKNCWNLKISDKLFPPMLLCSTSFAAQTIHLYLNSLICNNGCVAEYSIGVLQWQLFLS